jgi:hypothetical protein
MLLMANAKLLQNQGESLLKIHCREELETDDKGKTNAKHYIELPYFVYDKNTGEKIDASLSGKTLFTGTPY